MEGAYIVLLTYSGPLRVGTDVLCSRGQARLEISDNMHARAQPFKKLRVTPVSCFCVTCPRACMAAKDKFAVQVTVMMWKA